MWALQYHRYGDPSVLEAEELAIRKPKPGEVMVETVSSGVSAIDLMYNCEYTALVSRNKSASTSSKSPGNPGFRGSRPVAGSGRCWTWSRCAGAAPRCST